MEGLVKISPTDETYASSILKVKKDIKDAEKEVGRSPSLLLLDQENLRHINDSLS